MVSQIYNLKNEAYYEGICRTDFIDILEDKKYRILEIGCGTGVTAEYARKSNKVERYVGIELIESAARKAEAHVDSIHVCNVEYFDLSSLHSTFDVVIMSEVLEHLVDPWRVLRSLREIVTPDAWVFASSPVISHYSTILMLLRGRWDLTEVGRMDRTHLRWFTPQSYRQMFFDCGFAVHRVERMNKLGPRQAIAAKILPDRFSHLLTGQVAVHAKPAAAG